CFAVKRNVTLAPSELACHFSDLNRLRCDRRIDRNQSTGVLRNADWWRNRHIRADDFNDSFADEDLHGLFRQSADREARPDSFNLGVSRPDYEWPRGVLCDI